jgi:hypothetical protein
MDAPVPKPGVCTSERLGPVWLLDWRLEGNRTSTLLAATRSIEPALKVVILSTSDEDPQEAPENVAYADVELPNSLRIRVPGQGHGVIQSGCLYRVARDFVDSGTIKDLDTSCVEKMLMPFDLND